METTGLQNTGFYFNFDNKADHLKFHSTYTTVSYCNLPLLYQHISYFITKYKICIHCNFLHGISYNKFYNKVIIYTSVDDLHTQIIPNI